MQPQGTGTLLCVRPPVAPRSLPGVTLSRLALSIVLAAGLLALAASAAQARDGVVTSFDGTKIVYSFFPAHGLKAGQRAPTVMVGPGYSSGRSSDTSPEVAGLLDDGYNVLTWDPRGFGDSTGN